MMKKAILIITLLLCSIFAFGQKYEEVNLIQVDSTWGKEIIQIPFWFAPKINYKGYEDIRFARGWEKKGSSGFWTLVFAWDINLKKKPTIKFFEDNLTLYFDGLMKVVNEDKKIIIPKTEALFFKKESKKGITIFTGKIHTYDAFTTKETITLYVRIEVFYNSNIKKYFPLFKMSPKEFKHKTWKVLKKIKLQVSKDNKSLKTK